MLFAYNVSYAISPFTFNFFVKGGTGRICNLYAWCAWNARACMGHEPYLIVHYRFLWKSRRATSIALSFREIPTQCRFLISMGIIYGKQVHGTRLGPLIHRWHLIYLTGPKKKKKKKLFDRGIGKSLPRHDWNAPLHLWSSLTGFQSNKGGEPIHCFERKDQSEYTNQEREKGERALQQVLVFWASVLTNLARLSNLPISDSLGLWTKVLPRRRGNWGSDSGSSFRARGVFQDAR